MKAMQAKKRLFELDASQPNLNYLHVSPCNTTFYIDFVGGLLPNLTHAAFVVRNCDAEKFVDQPCIQCLCLGLIKADDSDVSVVVKADSPLQTPSFLRGHHRHCVTQARLVDCGGLSKIWAVCKAGTQEIECRVPRNFQPLSFDDPNHILSINALFL